MVKTFTLILTTKQTITSAEMCSRVVVFNNENRFLSNAKCTDKEFYIYNLENLNLNYKTEKKQIN